MAEKSNKSKPNSLNPAKVINLEEKVRAARKALLDMKEKLLADDLTGP
jgi:hypothetical protein